MSVRLNVVVVQHHDDEVHFIVGELRKAGFAPEWRQARSEGEFLSVLESPPQIVLASYSIPDFSTARALQLMREKRLDIPLIVISVMAGEETAVAAMRDGAADYLIKDRLGRLGRAVSEALERRRARANAREARRALAKRELSFAKAQQMAHLGDWEWELGTNEITWSEENFRIFGLEPSARKMSFEEFQSRIHPEDWPRLEAEISRALAKSNQYETEFRIVRPSGTIRTLQSRSEFVRDETGKPLRVHGITLDITEPKEAEAAMRRQTELLQTIFDNIPVMICVFDPEGRLQMFNHEFERVTGWTFCEVRNCDLVRELYPEPKDREFVRSFIQEAQGVWHEFKTRIKDGRVLDTAWANINLSDGGIIGIGQDISEQKTGEEFLRNTQERLRALSKRLMELQEAERRHLARELHDEVGQALTALKLNLEGAQAVATSPVVATSLNDSLALIGRLLDQVHALSLNLRPPILDYAGLIPAIKENAQQQSSRSGIRLLFSADTLESRLDPAIEIACFRVAQEAVTNVVRHARATGMTVELRACAGCLHLFVRDNGQGYDPAEKRSIAAQGGSLGLLGMEERVALAHGGIEFKPNAGRGMEVHAWFPIVSRAAETDS